MFTHEGDLASRDKRVVQVLLPVPCSDIWAAAPGKSCQAGTLAQNQVLSLPFKYRSA